MQLTSLLVAITGATLATAAEIESRIPRLGAFAVSQTFGCPLATRDFFEFALGAQSDACRTFYNNTTYQAIDVYYWKPECLLTLFNTYDCTDPGIVSGIGCWSPPGGIYAYKITCPYL
ncbi:hypothetical protein GE09DRAFT_1074178 [Coniochaeta sp. 2T2.1]|nr:hypothetical protein GE09DRAFT_1074178 [Coniochaeta sp. 2T2.1]